MNLTTKLSLTVLYTIIPMMTVLDLTYFNLWGTLETTVMLIASTFFLLTTVIVWTNKEED